MPWGGGAELGPKPACSLPLPAPAPGKVPAPNYTDFAQTPLGFRQSLSPGEALQHEEPRSLGRVRLTGDDPAQPAWPGTPCCVGVSYKELEMCCWRKAGPGLGSPARAPAWCKPRGEDHAGKFPPPLSLAGIASSAADKDREGPGLQQARCHSSKPSAA